MSKKSSKSTQLTDEQIEIIRVKPEDTQRLIDSLPYKIIPRPNDKKNPKGKMWCCYCGEMQTFIAHHPKVPLSTSLRCTNCSISVEDYYIKCHNGLWAEIKMKR